MVGITLTNIINKQNHQFISIPYHLLGGLLCPYMPLSLTILNGHNPYITTTSSYSSSTSSGGLRVAALPMPASGCGSSTIFVMARARPCPERGGTARSRPGLAVKGLQGALNEGWSCVLMVDGDLLDLAI